MEVFASNTAQALVVVPELSMKSRSGSKAGFISFCAGSVPRTLVPRLLRSDGATTYCTHRLGDVGFGKLMSAAAGRSMPEILNVPASPAALAEQLGLLGQGSVPGVLSSPRAWTMSCCFRILSRLTNCAREVVSIVTELGIRFARVTITAAARTRRSAVNARMMIPRCRDCETPSFTVGRLPSHWVSIWLIPRLSASRQPCCQK